MGRRKRRERARKWREWAFIIRFDSVKTTQRLTVGGRGDGVAIKGRGEHEVRKNLKRVQTVVMTRVFFLNQTHLMVEQVITTDHLAELGFK